MKYIVFLIFFFFPFGLFSANIKDLPKENFFNKYIYTSSFYQKAKYVAALLHSYYMYQQDYSDVYIPVRVRYGTYFDLILFGIKYSNFHSWSGYCHNYQSNVISYYMYSNDPGAKTYIPYSKRNDSAANFWCSEGNFPIVATYNLFNLLAMPGRLQTSGMYSGVPQNFSYSVYTYANQNQIRGVYFNTILGTSTVLDRPILGSIDLDSRKAYILQLSTDVPVWSDEQISNVWQYPENQYLDVGYLEAMPSDVVSTSTVIQIPTTYYTYIQVSTTVFLSFSTPVPVEIVNFPTISVSADMSTTNAILQNIYNFFSSTMSYEVDFSTYVEAVSDTYRQLADVFLDKIQVSTGVWDCTFHFGTVPFFGSGLFISDINLCEEYPFAIDLLKFLLKLAAYISAFWIVWEGVSNG